MGLNLVKALQDERSKRANEEEILAAFKQIIADDNRLDAEIHKAIINGGDGETPKLKTENLEVANIFTEQEIQAICIKYRLRFLDAGLFKGDIPYEAISKIKSIQKSEGIALKNFKIVAPAGLFKLKFKDKDPLLFLDLGKGYHYLIHKWGNDLHPLRGILMYPFRNFTTLFGTICGISLATAILMPSSIMAGPYDKYVFPIRVIFFFYMLIALCGLTSLYGFSRLKNFSSVLWNSKYDD
ncbi:MAG: hypothetical protein JJU02_04430 [Cryomorphaceae bacterium]|nr:hypothetical protein [Cryomorphaceae bacterium]